MQSTLTILILGLSTQLSMVAAVMCLSGTHFFRRSIPVLLALKIFRRPTQGPGKNSAVLSTGYGLVVALGTSDLGLAQPGMRTSYPETRPFFYVFANYFAEVTLLWLYLITSNRSTRTSPHLRPLQRKSIPDEL